jgi:hypothetical protein
MHRMGPDDLRKKSDEAGATAGATPRRVRQNAP